MTVANDFKFAMLGGCLADAADAGVLADQGRLGDAGQEAFAGPAVSFRS